MEGITMKKYLNYTNDNFNLNYDNLSEVVRQLKLNDRYKVIKIDNSRYILFDNLFNQTLKEIVCSDIDQAYLLCAQYISNEGIDLIFDENKYFNALEKLSLRNYIQDVLHIT